MNRLAAMQLCPLFWLRARHATVAAVLRSASASTRNGSEPPSSSTVFFSDLPADSATSDPAFSEPVSVTPATRWSEMRRSTAPDPMSSVWNTPSGTPASRKTSSMASADCGTLEECFSSITLPAVSAGSPARKACQKGKFHGMTARITPSGWNRT